MRGTLVATRRGVFGWLFLLLFIGFNLFMVQWLVSYWIAIAPVVTAPSSPGQAGATVGAMFGTVMIVFFWLAGAVIIGLPTYFTRGKTYLVADRQEAPR